MAGPGQKKVRVAESIGLVLVGILAIVILFFWVLARTLD